jgi:hypothetical protein
MYVIVGACVFQFIFICVCVFMCAVTETTTQPSSVQDHRAGQDALMDHAARSRQLAADPNALDRSVAYLGVPGGAGGSHSSDYQHHRHGGVAGGAGGPHSADHHHHRHGGVASGAGLHRNEQMQPQMQSICDENTIANGLEIGSIVDGIQRVSVFRHCNLEINLFKFITRACCLQWLCACIIE